MSPFFFSLYLDGLIQELRDLGLGCHIQGVWMGCAAFADDLVLLSPSRESMSKMLKVCEDYAHKSNLKFSTDPDPRKSKTKCLYMCGKTANVNYPAPLKLNNQNLPFVKEALHLGHYLHESCSMDHDVQVKKAQFINTSVEIRDIFAFAEPTQVLTAVRVYASHYYGSMLWQLDSDLVGQFCRTWSTCVKLSYNCPRSTRTWVVENLLATEFHTVQTELMARYVSFHKSLQKSASTEVSFLVEMSKEDERSTTSKNLHFIQDQTGLDPLKSNSAQIKNSAKKSDIPEGQIWRISTLNYLLQERKWKEDNLEKTDKISSLIDALCSA